MYVAAKHCEKIDKKPLFGRFKVIGVDKTKKPMTSACYDKQHVYLSATVFTLEEPIASFRGGPLFDAFVRGEL